MFYMDDEDDDKDPDENAFKGGDDGELDGADY